MNQLPANWEVLHATACAAGWCLSASSQGYQAPWTYSAFRPDGIWPNYERRQFETAAELGAWVAQGCPSLPDGWQIQHCSSGIWEARHLSRLTICYGDTQAEALALVAQCEAAIVASRAAREAWEAKQRPQKKTRPRVRPTEGQLRLFEERAA